MKQLGDSEGSQRAVRVALRSFDAHGCRRILDIGCRSGYLEERYPERFWGVEIDTDCVADACRRGIPRVYSGSALLLPFGPGTFDGVLMKYVIEHVDLVEVEIVLDEIARVLIPGGLLVLTTINAVQAFFDKAGHKWPYSAHWVRQRLCDQRGEYEWLGQWGLSHGIRGFGRLRLHLMADWLADRGIATHEDVVALRRL